MRRNRGHPRSLPHNDKSHNRRVYVSWFDIKEFFCTVCFIGGWLHAATRFVTRIRPCARTRDDQCHWIALLPACVCGKFGPQLTDHVTSLSSSVNGFHCHGARCAGRQRRLCARQGNRTLTATRPYACEQQCSHGIGLIAPSLMPSASPRLSTGGSRSFGGGCYGCDAASIFFFSSCFPTESWTEQKSRMCAVLKRHSSRCAGW